MKNLCQSILSFLLILSMLIAIPLHSLAQGNEIETQSNELISIIEIEDTYIYTVVMDGVVYSVQIGNNGLTVVSYATADASTAYQSDSFSCVDTISEFNNLNLVDVTNLILQVPEDEYTPIISVSEQEQSFPGISLLDADSGSDNGSGTLVSTIVDNTFGSAYRNKLVKTATRSYDRTYTFYCYESQTNLRLKNQSISVAANAAVSTIIAWLATGAFSVSWSWFLSACGAVYTTIEGVKRVVNAFSADAYYYEVSRVRNIKTSSVTTDVLYSTSWTIKEFFVNSQNGWKHTNYSNYKHSEYDNFDSQFDNALTRLVLNYL